MRSRGWQHWTFRQRTMLFHSLLGAAALLAVSSASPIGSSEHYVVHEKRDALPHGWSRKSVIDKDAIIPMRIALTQGNVEKGWDWLDEVSNPDSEKYGQHWKSWRVLYEA